jgi:hypothetical protein
VTIYGQVIGRSGFLDNWSPLPKHPKPGNAVFAVHSTNASPTLISLAGLQAPGVLPKNFQYTVLGGIALFSFRTDRIESAPDGSAEDAGRLYPGPDRGLQQALDRWRPRRARPSGAADSPRVDPSWPRIGLQFNQRDVVRNVDNSIAVETTNT